MTGMAPRENGLGPA